MARFTRAQLESFNGALVDDLVGGRVRLLFVGINPGLWTAAVNAHFARRGNRFWPALHAAGITPYEVDASDGMRADDLAMLAALGVGITNIVPTASARADELTRAELRLQEQRYWRLVAERKGAVDERMQEFRWLLEELRVSFFAQELRTPQPVSVKRLDKVWAQLG